MAQPTVRVPEWASGGTTTDPGAGKESTGWVVSERPPANWWNWILNALGQWVGYMSNSAVRARGTADVVIGSVNLDADHQDCSAAITSGETVITFDSALASANYQVICTVEAEDQDWIATCYDKTTASFKVDVWDASANARKNPSSDTFTFDFVVFGGN
jgi:hypothetical protein